jgi:glucose/mannose-6-phosphate isomerase
MGGSALAGNFLYYLNQCSSKAAPAICLNRDYRFPFRTSGKELVITVSYSGNTEETLSCYREAHKMGLKIIAISTGGTLENIAKKDGVQFVQLPHDPPVSPRFGLFAIMGALLKVLANANLFEEDMLKRATETAETLDPMRSKEQGMKIAEFLKDKIALIYSSERQRALALNWKLKMNESAHIPCFAGYFPEMNHNELTSFTNPKLIKGLSILIFKSDDDYEEIKKRMSLTAEMLKTDGMPVMFVECGENNIWERMFNNSLLGDWTAFFLAEYYGIDPTNSEVVETFKKKLATS